MILSNEEAAKVLSAMRELRAVDARLGVRLDDARRLFECRDGAVEVVRRSGTGSSFTEYVERYDSQSAFAGAYGL